MARKKKSNAGTVIVIIILFYIALNYKGGLFTVSDPFDYGLPSKTVSKDIEISFDQSTWTSVTTPFPEGELETWQVGPYFTGQGTADPVTGRNNVCYWELGNPNAGTENGQYYSQQYVNNQAAAYPENCIGPTESQWATGSCYCYGAGCGGGYGRYEFFRSCQLSTGGVSDEYYSKDNFYIRKIFDIEPGSPGAWLKLISPGMDLSTVTSVSPSDITTISSCYLNGNQLSLSTMGVRISKSNDWGFQLIMPYHDISSSLVVGSNELVCNLEKDFDSFPTFDFEIVTYGPAECQKKHIMRYGENYPVDIDFQITTQGELIHSEVDCSYPEFDAQIKETTQYEYTEDSGTKRIGSVYAGLYGAWPEIMIRGHEDSEINTPVLVTMPTLLIKERGRYDISFAKLAYENTFSIGGVPIVCNFNGVLDIEGDSAHITGQYTSCNNQETVDSTVPFPESGLGVAGTFKSSGGSLSEGGYCSSHVVDYLDELARCSIIEDSVDCITYDGYCSISYYSEEEDCQSHEGIWNGFACTWIAQGDQITPTFAQLILIKNEIELPTDCAELIPYCSRSLGGQAAVDQMTSYYQQGICTMQDLLSCDAVFKCGNGVCDGFETYSSCPADCEQGDLLGDTDGDDKVDRIELLNFGGIWVQGGYSSEEMLQVITNWARS